MLYLYSPSGATMTHLVTGLHQYYCNELVFQRKCKCQSLTLGKLYQKNKEAIKLRFGGTPSSPPAGE